MSSGAGEEVQATFSITRGSEGLMRGLFTGFYAGNEVVAVFTVVAAGLEKEEEKYGGERGIGNCKSFEYKAGKMGCGLGCL